MQRQDCAVSLDRLNGRLVYKGRDANEELWDDQWSKYLAPKHIRSADRFVLAETQRHVPHGGKVLDAGCGPARTVWGLHHAGYEAFGADFAPATVRAVNKIAPELSVVEADVRNLPFADGFFDAVWSLGVIEHFPEGYRSIIDEMQRVTKPGGIALVTVPSMSPLRRLRALLRTYPEFNGSFEDFYQFVLPPRSIVEEFETAGWSFSGGSARGGLKGLKDEAGPLLPLLQRLYDHPSNGARWLRAGLNRVLAPACYHTRLYRFIRN
jgi:SAM-dependent methyltransferase